MLPEFDAIAHDYDAAFSHTTVGRLLRARVWYCTGGFSFRTIASAPAAKAAGTVLELNCGTGEDAIWFAKQGFQVLATDVSPEMVAVAKAKIAQAGLSENAMVRVCSFAEIEKIPEGNFDLIFSNFGGLNCVSPPELRQLGPILAQKLKPGGKFVAVVMSRFCWWETLYFLLKMKPREAFRRFSRKPLDAQLDALTTVSTWYYSPSEFYKILNFNGFKPRFKPIGLWLPPSYLNPFFEKHMRLLGVLNFLEKKLAPQWLAFAADHFMICLKSKQS
ncbi:MAG: methyltransferase domain-containing protein [Saprospiraceae bacterium]|nr:methyltransferase domain-containing protein [Saprospiraceae bacterium]